MATNMHTKQICIQSALMHTYRQYMHHICCTLQSKECLQCGYKQTFLSMVLVTLILVFDCEICSNNNSIGQCNLFLYVELDSKSYESTQACQKSDKSSLMHRLSHCHIPPLVSQTSLKEQIPNGSEILAVLSSVQWSVISPFYIGTRYLPGAKMHLHRGRQGVLSA